MFFVISRFPAAQYRFEFVIGFLDCDLRPAGDLSSCLSGSAVPQQSLAQFSCVISEHFLSIEVGCSPGTSKIHEPQNRNSTQRAWPSLAHLHLRMRPADRRQADFTCAA